MTNQAQIDICICTYKRPNLLKATLISIEQQKLPPDINVKIFVVDNDANASAEFVVNEFKMRGLIDMAYDVEPEQNIAIARNRSVRTGEGDYVAFIDDDEVASENWLSHLYDCLRRYEADVVFGPVIPVFPNETPDWVIKGRFFDRERSETGTIKKHGATNNTLVKRYLFAEHGYQFNKNYGLTGGSDTELFHKITKAGFKLVWCNDAIVHEDIILNRITEQWLIKRAFRGGQTFARIFVQDMNTFDLILWLSRRVLFLTICAVILPFSWFGGRQLLVKCLQKTASNIGQLSGFTGWQYQEYKR